MGLLGLGSTEIILILVFFAMLFLGGKKIPEFARGLGRAMGEFKRGRLEIEREIQVSGM
ncbi:MAG: twin-arginine translocase TatA/TatE family subunit, partial [Candidatus Thermoplasmatota archaeon]|nr:twin-arginine translocase TatA/TatE family subunit [Candidatus Thermoplasmatota archaeon]